MDDILSIVLVAIFGMCGLMMMIMLLNYYVRFFWDLCCPLENCNRQRGGPQDFPSSSTTGSDAAPLNGTVEEESMPTESDYV